MPLLVAAGSRPAPGELENLGALDGEISAGGNPLALLTALIESTEGDLLFLRPDAWAMPRESAMSRVVGRAIDSGRRSRAVYPLRALHEAPEVLRARGKARAADNIGSRQAIIPARD